MAEQNRLVLETANDAILVLDPQRRISFANPAAAELMARRDLVGTVLSSLAAPELTEQIEAHTTASLDGESRRYDATFLRVDGERRQVSVSQAALRDVSHVIGIVVAIRDVTDEHRARDAMEQIATEERVRGVALARSEARYTELVESASDAIFTVLLYLVHV